MPLSVNSFQKLSNEKRVSLMWMSSCAAMSRAALMSSTRVLPIPEGVLLLSSLIPSPPMDGNIHQRTTSTPLFFMSVRSVVRAALSAATPFWLHVGMPPKSPPKLDQA